MGAHSWRMAVSCTLPNLHFIIEAICQPFVTCNYWCILLGDGSFLYTPKFVLSCWAALSTLCYLQLVHTPWGRLCPVYSQIWASLLNSFVNPLSPAMGAYSRGKAMSCTFPNLHFIIETLCQPFVTCNWCILLGEGCVLETPKSRLHPHHIITCTWDHSLKVFTCFAGWTIGLKIENWMMFGQQF